uniref:NUDE domain-containing protein n=1 Tax=Timema bartmani TaxID=61472 RepID=A0A7R9F049_9NEOP|nr:unnamed protein product [Timema bartmani]
MQILELQTSVSEYNNRQETLVKYIRELEQKNDDLERANRAMMTSLGESETKLNTAIERNAILEVEQDETKSILQRLKDESRDLLQEMKIRGPQVPDNDKSLERVCSPIDSNKLTVEIQTPTGIPGSPLKISHPGGIQNIPLTPSTRISGMNIVSDLIRKIGALESKLASCRNASREIPLPGDSMSREVFSSELYLESRTVSWIHDVAECACFRSREAGQSKGTRLACGFGGNWSMSRRWQRVQTHVVRGREKVGDSVPATLVAVEQKDVLTTFRGTITSLADTPFSSVHAIQTGVGSGAGEEKARAERAVRWCRVPDYWTYRCTEVPDYNHYKESSKLQTILGRTDQIPRPVLTALARTEKRLSQRACPAPRCCHVDCHPECPSPYLSDKIILYVGVFSPSSSSVFKSFLPYATGGALSKPAELMPGGEKGMRGEDWRKKMTKGDRVLNWCSGVNISSGRSCEALEQSPGEAGLRLAQERSLLIAMNYLLGHPYPAGRST